MGPLFETYSGLMGENKPRSAPSCHAPTLDTCCTEDATIVFDSALSEMSFDDTDLTDEGRLSRALQSWMTDYVIIPIEPMVKPPRQPVYSGRLGKKTSLRRVPSSESIETKISLLSCSTRENSPDGLSSTTTKRRRRKKGQGSRIQSAVVHTQSIWEKFAKSQHGGALDRFSKTHNALQMDVIQKFDDDESEAFHMMDPDEQKMLRKVGLTRGLMSKGKLKKSPSLSNVKDIGYLSTKKKPTRTLSAGAKPRSKAINVEEIRQQRMREKIAQIQKQQRSRGGRRSFLSNRMSRVHSAISTVDSDLAPQTPSIRSLSSLSDNGPISVWRGDREILEMDLRRGLTARVKKKIDSTTKAINRVTGYGETNEQQTVIGRHEEFPRYVDEDYCCVPKIVQRIRITPDLSHVIKEDMRIRMGRPRYHEINVRDLQMWNKGQKLDRSHTNLKVFNWLHSLKEDDFDKDIDPVIDDSVPSCIDEVEILHVEAADDPDIEPLYLKKFKTKQFKMFKKKTS